MKKEEDIIKIIYVIDIEENKILTTRNIAIISLLIGLLALI